MRFTRPQTPVRKPDLDEHPFWADHVFNPAWLLTVGEPSDIARWDQDTAGIDGRTVVYVNGMNDPFTASRGMAGVQKRMWELFVRYPRLDWVLHTGMPRQMNGAVPDSWVTFSSGDGPPQVGFPGNIHVGVRLVAGGGATQTVAASELKRLAPSSSLFLDVEPGVDLGQVEPLISDGQMQVLSNTEQNVDRQWADRLARMCARHKVRLTTP